MKSEVYLYDYYIVIVSDSLDTDIHSHLAHQITISRTNDKLRVNISGEVVEKKYVYIPSLVEHQFHKKEGDYLTILVDNESAFKISKLKFEDSIKRMVKVENSKEELDHLLTDLGLLCEKSLDPRIEKCLRIISQVESLDMIRLSSVSKDVALSESHFLHLFKSEVGVPFRKYILWKKLKRALGLITKGEVKSLTQVAHQAGFSDSAHFSKVIKTTFGISPSLILKNSQFIQG